MKEECLYIIGNGFDLKHGMSTKYSDFKRWLFDNGRIDVIQELQKAFPAQNGDAYILWSDFEKALGLYDINVVLNWSWEDLYLTEISIGGQVFGAPNFLLNTRLPDILSEAFAEWACSIPIPNSPKDYALDRCAYFLSFNYTDTLEVLYGIPEESITHIHGRASLKEKLVVGHNRETDPGDYWDNSLDMRENNERMQRLMDMNELRKPYWEILERNRFFFQKLGGIRDVFVLGHSCAEVDVPYFRKVKESVDSEAIWHFSPYGEEDRLRIINLMKMISIDYLHAVGV